MSRSSKKGPYVDPNLLKKIMQQKQSGDKGAIKTWARDSVISPDFVGHTLLIHKGKGFEEVYISESMVGHKVGEFARTRNFRGHGNIVKRTMTKT